MCDLNHICCGSCGPNDGSQRSWSDCEHGPSGCLPRNARTGDARAPSLARVIPNSLSRAIGRISKGRLEFAGGLDGQLRFSFPHIYRSFGPKGTYSVGCSRMF